MPCVVKLPAGATDNPSWQAGGFNRSFATCMDMLPTFLDLARISVPRDGNKCLRHRGRLTHPIRGKSWMPYLQSNDVAHPFSFWREDEAIGWELHEQAALKKGHYKIVYIKRTSGGKADGADDPNGWELFNLTTDPGETQDLSSKEPEKFRELLADWDTYVRETGLVWGPQAMEPGLTVQEAPHLHDVDMELQRTWLQTPHGQRVLV